MTDVAYLLSAPEAYRCSACGGREQKRRRLFEVVETRMYANAGCGGSLIRSVKIRDVVTEQEFFVSGNMLLKYDEL